MNASVLILSVLFVVFGSCDEDENTEAKLRFYYGSLENYTELYIYDAVKIFAERWHHSSRDTVIFSYGYTGQPDGPAVTGVMSAYINGGKSNVALLNWKELASMALPGFASSYVNWAAPNARKLGVRFADTLMNMSAAGLDLDRTHLVGHSLAAHIFGIAGNTMAQKGVQPSCITGLDPSRVGFDGKQTDMRLNEASAKTVVVIHTDSDKYGARTSLGKVDFWPNYRQNGRFSQPGCEKRPGPTFSMKDLCDHNRSWELLIDALKYPGTLIGSNAKSYRAWKKFSKKERNDVTLEIGKCNINAVPGNYYLLTNAESPYGRGEEGL